MKENVAPVLVIALRRVISYNTSVGDLNLPLREPRFETTQPALGAIQATRQIEPANSKREITHRETDGKTRRTMSQMQRLL